MRFFAFKQITLFNKDKYEEGRGGGGGKDQGLGAFLAPPGTGVSAAFGVRQKASLRGWQVTWWHTQQFYNCSGF